LRSAWTTQQDTVFKNNKSGHQWFTPVILATQEAEIRRIVVRSQPGQIVCKILSQKKNHKKRTGRVAQGEGPEFNPCTTKKKKKLKE
jgi:hypothetical protein